MCLSVSDDCERKCPKASAERTSGSNTKVSRVERRGRLVASLNNLSRGAPSFIERKESVLS